MRAKWENHVLVSKIIFVVLMLKRVSWKFH